MSVTGEDERHRGLPRVVVLGGGAGALTTAVSLSQPGWREHFESITVYQQGWRLGGKGASGRGHDRRIEEHGLHIWFGSYHNAFHMMGRCHEELDERQEAHGLKRWDLAFTTMAESFTARREITVTDHDGCCWSHWRANFFNADDRVPWTEAPEDPTVLGYLSAALWLAADLLASLVASAPHLWREEDDASEPFARVGEDAALLAAAAAPHALSDAGDALDALARGAVEVLAPVLDLVLAALEAAGEIFEPVLERLLGHSDAVRRAWYVIDLLLAIVRGVIHDGCVVEEDLAIIDDVEFRDWLLSHGAAQESVDCVLIRTVIYDLPFAYVDGDAREPSFAAGTALRLLLHLFFDNTGAVMWKLNTGMGDAVFAPLYELLVKRGVDVRFFHRVERLTVADGHVETIELDLQVDVPAGVEPHDYLLDGGLWPANPSENMTWLDPAVDPAVYESWYLGRSRVSTTTLRRGASEDGFELVVFGLPIGCVPLVAQDLVDRVPGWAKAVEHVRTVPTQALQLWLNRPAPQLGEVSAGEVLGGYTEPFDTWADMQQLVDQERVAGSRTVAYFCNVAPDSAAPPRGSQAAADWLKEQTELVRHRAIQFLRGDIKALWRDAVDPVTDDFDWDLLVAPDDARGERRLDAQYWRANVEPAERYTLSVPGSSRHRIKPEATGLANLFAAGDWTSCHLDSGCVEAAVVSGLLAANGIHMACGAPDRVQSIIGWGP